jgi:hypothetical protein
MTISARAAFALATLAWLSLIAVAIGAFVQRSIARQLQSAICHGGRTSVGKISGREAHD